MRRMGLRKNLARNQNGTSTKKMASWCVKEKEGVLIGIDMVKIILAGKLLLFG